ncbi:unnamed protein product [Thelazia callipaeda]|uniref:NF2 n=1 Tax=Thelazia callipaeda TaxID=103827 RepID=A0A0N5CP35_THECL|nr:unnamed protein product [Thelazia callipaeda]
MNALSDCSKNYQKTATEFTRKFPMKTIRDVKEKRLAEVVKQQLSECDLKSRSNHWQILMKLLPDVKLSPSEEEECKNGLIQERIACVNLISYTCQFIKRDYKFRLVPARVIMQEARLAEDGANKCSKVIRHIKKHNLPK